MSTSKTKAATKSTPVRTKKVAAAKKTKNSTELATPGVVVDGGAQDAAPKVGNTNALMAMFCDRLNQAIDRRPDVIRTGRGRTNDFKDRFGLHYTTAHRLLEGEALPNFELLSDMSRFFDLPVGWFYGEGAADIDVQIDQSSLGMELFAPRSNKSKSAQLPLELFPAGFDSGRLMICRVAGATGQEVLIVRVSSEARDGEEHVIYFPENDSLEVRRLSLRKGPSDAITAVSPRTGDAYALHPSECQFGEPSKQKITVIGPVVAKLLVV